MLYALLLIVAFEDGTTDVYAIHTDMTLEACQAAAEEFPMDNMRGVLECSVYAAHTDGTI